MLSILQDSSFLLACSNLVAGIWSKLQMITPDIPNRLATQTSLSESPHSNSEPKLKGKLSGAAKRKIRRGNSIKNNALLIKRSAPFRTKCTSQEETLNITSQVIDVMSKRRASFPKKNLGSMGNTSYTNFLKKLISENNSLKEAKKDLEIDLKDSTNTVEYYFKKTYESTSEKNKLQNICREINKKFKDCNTVQIPMKTFGDFGNATLSLNHPDIIRINEEYFDPTFHPFYVDSKTETEHINTSDPKLVELQVKFGSAVKDDVIRALVEINKWNPSGGYPISLPWNFDTNKELTSSEILNSIVYQIFNNTKIELNSDVYA